MKKSFRRIKRECSHECRSCAKNLCPLVAKERRIEKLNYKPASVFKSIYMFVFNYILGIAAIVVGVCVITYPQLFGEWLSAQEFIVRMVIASACVLAGATLMRIANRRKVKQMYDRWEHYY